MFINASKIGQKITHYGTYIRVEGTHISRTPCIGCGWNVYTCQSES